MRILVTGGTGFIGSNIARALIARGDDVIITGSNAEQKLPDFKGKYLQPTLIGIDWDAIGHVDAIFHEAAINDATARDEREVMRANVDASMALFEYVAAHGCKRIVYASSTSVYGSSPAPHVEDHGLEPLGPYGKSKKLLDEKAMAFAAVHPDIIVVGLRYSNVYGPGEAHKGSRANMVHQFAKQMKHGDPIVYQDGEQRRDFIYIKDVVRANLLALEAKESCIVNCGSGTSTSFNEIVSVLNKTMGLERTPQYAGTVPASGYQRFTQCDMTLAKAKLGFIPEYTIEAGVAEYFESGHLTGHYS